MYIEEHPYSSCTGVNNSSTQPAAMPRYPSTYDELINTLASGDVTIPLQIFREEEQVKAASQAIQAANGTASKLLLIVGRTTTTDIQRATSTDIRAAGETRLLPDNVWEPLLEVLELWEELSTVVIVGNPLPGDRGRKVPGHIVTLLRTLLFPALKRNTNIRELFLWDDLDISDLISASEMGQSDLISFLNGAPALQKLSMWECRGQAGKYRILADALQRSTTVQTLSLSCLQHTEIILLGLASNSNRSPLRELRYTSTFWERAPPALEQYLQSRACTLYSIKLSRVWLTEGILRILGHNTKVGDIIFTGSSLTSGGLPATAGAQEALSHCLTRPHVSQLRLENCCRLLEQKSVREAFCASLVLPTSSLLSLYLSVHRPHGPWDGTKELLAALSKNSQLEHLTIKTDKTSFTLPTLVEVIPSFRAKSFALVHEGPNQIHSGHAASLLLSIKKNYHFLKVAIDVRGPYLNVAGWSRHRDTMLNFCQGRNTKLVEWSANPSLVPEHLWPYALALASKAGTHALYTSLYNALAPQPSLERTDRERHD